MTTIISGSSPSITFSDSTTQTTAFTSTPSVTSITTSADASINGLTVGKGGGAVSNNTAVGASALAGNTSGESNTAVGYRALVANTTDGNCAFGSYTLTANTTGAANTGFGFNALAYNTTASNNTAVGGQSLFNNTTASNNTAVGYQAGYSNQTGLYNTFVGYQAGYNSIGSSGTGSNSCFGILSGNQLTTGTINTFLGQSSGYYVTTGSKNTILGSYSGNQGGLDIRTASNYIVLSDGDGNPRIVTDSNGWTIINPPTSSVTNIGSCAFSVYGTNTGAGNQMIAMRNTGATSGKFWYQAVSSGNSVYYLNGSSVGVTMADGATAWSAYSDLRLKNVTGSYLNALADIAKLEPIKFTWKSDADNKPCVGISAQSVVEVVPEAVDNFKLANADEINDQTEYLGVRYTELIPLMIASIQELKAEFDAYKASHP